MERLAGVAGIKVSQLEGYENIGRPLTVTRDGFDDDEQGHVT